jgi:hypothetical protein
MISSYTDYGIYTNVISNHLSLLDISEFQILFGKGFRKNDSDVGYIKTIYTTGLTGILLQLTYYFVSIHIINNIRKISSSNIYIYLFSIVYIISIFLMFIMEAKMQIIFSSTTFEMLSIVLIALITNQKYLEVDLKRF